MRFLPRFELAAERRMMMKGLTARRVAAAVHTVVWLVGLHVLPLAHNLDHRPDHSHGPRVPPPSHVHPHPHSHTAEHGPPEPERSRHDHGAGSLLHYAVAVVEEDAPALVAPGPALAWRASPTPKRPASLTRVSHLARGPPLLLT